MDSVTVSKDGWMVSVASELAKMSGSGFIGVWLLVWEAVILK